MKIKSLMLPIFFAARTVCAAPAVSDPMSVADGQAQCQVASAAVGAKRQAYAPAQKLPQYEKSVEYGAILQVLHLEPQAADKALAGGVDMQQRVDEAVYRKGWQKVSALAAAQTKPWAVVLDLDETVIDNSPAQQIFDAQYGGKFNFGAWSNWIKKQQAAALPGAKDFLDRLHQLVAASAGRGRVVYITDRNDSQAADTVENLKKLGLWGKTDLLLTKANGGDNKALRRICVIRGNTGQNPDPRCSGDTPRQIVALFGDSLRDFEELCGRPMAESLRGSSKWGSSYFPLWNQEYGQWEKDYRCN